MTDLPKEDRDLIERVLGKDEVRWLARIGCNTFSVEMVAKLLAAARDEGRDEGLGGEWVIVPRVPTVEMLVAATEEWLCVRSQEDRAEFIWDAMLAAAPAPPTSQTQEG